MIPASQGAVEKCDRQESWPFRSGCYGHQDECGWMAGKYDHNRVIQAFARHRLAAIASAPAGDGVEEAFRQALEDVCNPLAYLQRKAEAEGARLGGMAYAIANDIATVQGIARDALAAALARPRAAVGEREAE